jgi:hypothetical protein
MKQFLLGFALASALGAAAVVAIVPSDGKVDELRRQGVAFSISGCNLAAAHYKDKVDCGGMLNGFYTIGKAFADPKKTKEQKKEAIEPLLEQYKKDETPKK